jgi:hypothetical protein
MKTRITLLSIVAFALTLQSVTAFAEEPSKAAKISGKAADVTASAAAGAASGMLFLAPLFAGADVIKKLKIGNFSNNEALGFGSLMATSINMACGAAGAVVAAATEDNSVKEKFRKNSSNRIASTVVASAATILTMGLPLIHVSQPFVIFGTNCALSATGGYIAGTMIQDTKLAESVEKLIDRKSASKEETKTPANTVAVNRSPAFEGKYVH